MLRLLVPTALVLTLGAARAAEPERAPGRPPNIVLIVSDDQGYRDLGCFGGPEIQTPNLDRLAAEGIRLTSFYVTWPACTPSRGSLLTGRYPQRNGLYDMIRNDLADTGYKYDEVTYALSPEMTLGMDLREVMISQPLRDAGYATGVVGKWDGGRARRFLPLQRGFDTYYGFANTGIDYWTHERYGVPSLFRGNDRIKEEGYATDLFRREALQFIERNKDRPFFLYVPFNAPHGASSLTDRGVQAPDEAIRLYPDKDPMARRTKYMACVTHMDRAIGAMLDLLKKHGLEEETLVIFHSDNGGSGPADNSPLRGHKSQMFEGGFRVPCIVRGPGKVPAGTTSDAFLSSLEVFPTLVAAAGAKLPEGVILDGFDMLPVLQGTRRTSRIEMFWERRLDRAARVGPYKWVESAAGGGLFDLSHDLSEKNDLSRSKPQVLEDVKARFAAWRTAMDQAEPRGPFRDY
jgi:arylsulfatase A-like enzyme